MGGSTEGPTAAAAERVLLGLVIRALDYSPQRKPRSVDVALVQRALAPPIFLPCTVYGGGAPGGRQRRRAQEGLLREVGVNGHGVIEGELGRRGYGKRRNRRATTTANPTEAGSGEKAKRVRRFEELAV